MNLRDDFFLVSLKKSTFAYLIKKILSNKKYGNTKTLQRHSPQKRTCKTKNINSIDLMHWFCTHKVELDAVTFAFITSKGNIYDMVKILKEKWLWTIDVGQIVNIKQFPNVIPEIWNY